jgi:hypothetical protein
MYTDNPIRDAEAYDREQDAWLARRPICCGCGEHIQNDTLFRIGGQAYCWECVRSEFEEDIEED